MNLDYIYRTEKMMPIFNLLHNKCIQSLHHFEQNHMDKLHIVGLQLQKGTLLKCMHMNCLSQNIQNSLDMNNSSLSHCTIYFGGIISTYYLSIKPTENCINMCYLGTIMYVKMCKNTDILTPLLLIQEHNYYKCYYYSSY